MADGFKIDDAFIEVHAKTDHVSGDVRRSVRNIERDVGGDADRLGNGIGGGISRGMTRGLAAGAESGSIFANVLGTMASKASIFGAAGLGAIGIGQQLSGVIGLLPALGFAGAAGLAAVAIGTQGFGDALKNMGDPEKFNEALAKLSPTARAAAVAVNELRPAWSQMQQVVQDKLFSGIAEDIKNLGTTYMPVLTTGLGGVATSIGGMVREWAGFATAPDTVRDTNDMFANTKGFLDGLSTAIVPFSQALTDIGVVGSGFLPQIGTWVGDIATKFGEFIAHARDSGQLKVWIQTGLDTLSALWDVVKNIGKAVWDLATVFGPPLLGALVVLSPVLSGITGFLKDMAPVLIPLVLGIGGVVVAMKTWAVATDVLRVAFDLLKFASPWTLIITAVVVAVMLIIYNWDTVKTWLLAAWDAIKAAAVAVWDAITGFIKGAIELARNVITAVWGSILGFLNGIWDTIKNTARSVWGSIVGFINGAVDTIKGIIQWFADLPGKIGGWFSGAYNAARDWLGQMVGYIRGIPGQILSALGSVGSLLYNSGRSLITGLWDGISGAVGWVKGKVSGVLSSIRDLFPFSPAKEGPFSGRGYTTYSGRALARDFAGGVLDEQSTVKSALSSVLGAGQASVGVGSSGIASALSGAASGSGAPILSIGTVVIDAKSVGEMQSVVEFFQKIQQTARTGPSSFAGVRA